MKRLRLPILAILGAFQLFLLLVAFEKPAHAYVDPGSGLLFLQVGGSMLAGAVFVLRNKVRKFFGLASAADKNILPSDMPSAEKEQ